MKNLIIFSTLFVILMTQGCTSLEQMDTEMETPATKNEASKNDTITFSALDTFNFTFPQDWKENEEEHPFDLQCFSGKNDMSTGVFVYGKIDLAEGSSASDTLDAQIDSIGEKRANFKLIETTKDEKTDGKRIKSIVYTGENESASSYYIFSLVEFDDNDHFAIVLQTCLPSSYEKNKNTLADIVNSCTPVE